MSSPSYRDVQLRAEAASALARREQALAELRRFEGSRWQLIRAVSVFQLKLAIDGLKDFVLAPLGAFALLLDLKRAKSGEKWEAFERVMLLGERFERWLALYGTAGRSPLDPDDPLDVRSGGILDEGGSDVILDSIELTAKKIGREIRDRKGSPAPEDPTSRSDD